MTISGDTITTYSSDEALPEQRLLPTPDEMPDPHEFQDALETIESQPSSSTLQHPSQEIHGNVDISNILEGQRIWKPSSRKQNYLDMLSFLGDSLSLHAVFTAGIKIS